MLNLKVHFENCYGIQKLEETFVFQNCDLGRAIAIYAPNGSMKTSFTKTFSQIGKGLKPSDDRFDRKSIFEIKADGIPLSKDSIYTLPSTIDIAREPDSMTAILVNPSKKKIYDGIYSNLRKGEISLISRLNRKSGVRKNEIKKQILADFDTNNFLVFLSELDLNQEVEIGEFKYNDLFSADVLGILEDPDFIKNSEVFINSYTAVFESVNSPFQRGVFNPQKAEIALKGLSKNGYFQGGHRVHFKNESHSLSEDEVALRLNEVRSTIENDQTLKVLLTKLGENAKSQKLANIIERLNVHELESFLEQIKPDNIGGFRKKLWLSYLKDDEGIHALRDYYESNKIELDKIEEDARKSAPTWGKAVALFNDRFVNMPFTLILSNQKEAVLGMEPAKINFKFKDINSGGKCKIISREQLNQDQTLSQGEMRAIHLLSFIFDMEERAILGKDCIIIIDDPADSFDYKNKCAIVQYLKDLGRIERFRLIVLTHNFDFFRTISENRLVHRDRCFMANRKNAEVSLVKAEGIGNIFINLWKNRILEDDQILYSSVAFVRNLIEYTRGSEDLDYKTLTSLLHWKIGTENITVSDYIRIYNNLFKESHEPKENSGELKMVEVLFYEANQICEQKSWSGLELKRKVLLSIAIRMKAEQFMTDKIREQRSNPNYWSPAKGSQFGKLLGEFKKEFSSNEVLTVLEQTSVTISSNIHLNSFMFEPILDLTIEHLIALYKKVTALRS